MQVPQWSRFVVGGGSLGKEICSVGQHWPHLLNVCGTNADVTITTCGMTPWKMGWMAATVFFILNNTMQCMMGSFKALEPRVALFSSQDSYWLIFVIVNMETWVGGSFSSGC